MFVKTRGKLSDLNISAWEHELSGDVDREFILNGIKNGFMIVDELEVTSKVESNNHPSAHRGQHRRLVEQQIKIEIDEGRYVKVNHKPDICSPLASIVKDDGSMRVIHDASRQHSQGLNSYAVDNCSVKYQTIKDAINMLHPGDYMCKVDLKSAYRSTGINPSQYHMSGIKWQFEGDEHDTYLVDTRLMMGSRKAPMIFHRLSQAVRRFIETRGYRLIVYLDDFFLVADTFEACLEDQHVLIRLLRELGFAISWPKVQGPTKNLVFLGIEINTVSGMISLPQNKLEDFRTLLSSYEGKNRASCRQLQTLVGKLQWACQVVKSGRCYLRSILDTLAPLRISSHKARLSKAFMTDISWWIAALKYSSGRRLLFSPNINVVGLDACDTGAGMVFGQDWDNVDWVVDVPRAAGYHINCKETIAAVLAARRWAPYWRDSVVVFHTDNITARAWLRKGYARSPCVMPWLRELYLLSVWYNFEIACEWIPGVENVLPDAISHFRLPLYCRYVLFCIGIDVSNVELFPYYVPILANHMSDKALFCVISRSQERPRTTAG